jgi:hypothetical protein
MRNIKIYCNLIFLFFTLIQKTCIASDTLTIYPNPFCKEVTIKFNLSKTDTISLNLLDIVGTNKKNIITEAILPSGDYTIYLQGDSIVNGVYVLQLKFGTRALFSKRVIKSDCSTVNSEIVAENMATYFYPNPAQNILNINIAERIHITITDMQGKICKKIVTDQNQIDISDLQDGIYTCSIATENNTLILKQNLIIKK